MATDELACGGAGRALPASHGSRDKRRVRSVFGFFQNPAHRLVFTTPAVIVMPRAACANAIICAAGMLTVNTGRQPIRKIYSSAIETPIEHRPARRFEAVDVHVG